MQTETTSNELKTPSTTDGILIGQSAIDLVGFYGATPVAQPTSSSQAAVATTAPTNSSPYGYTTSAQAAAIVTLLNEIRSVLVAAGLMKGS